MPEKIKLTETVTSRSIELPQTFQKASLPWEQLPEESLLWYQRFLVYRDLPDGHRNINRAYHEHAAIIDRQRKNTKTLYLKKPLGPLAGVQKDWPEAHDRFKWDERTELYHAHCQRLIEETKDRELQKIVERDIHEQYAVQKEGDKLIVAKALEDIRLLVSEGKRLKPSEAINFYRIGTSNQHELNAILMPNDKKERVAGQFCLNAGHSSSSVQELISRIEDGRPKSVIEAEEKLRLENTTSQQNQQSELVPLQEVDCYEEP